MVNYLNYFSQQTLHLTVTVIQNLIRVLLFIKDDFLELSCLFVGNNQLLLILQSWLNGAYQTCKIIAWVQNLLSEMDVKVTQPVTLFQYNEVTIRNLHHKSNEARTKHIALRYNMIRKFIQERLIAVKYLSTDLMTADTLTKALSGPTFVCHQIRLFNLVPSSLSSLPNM